MNQEELYDLIERYLDGTLTETERQDVEQRLATDPDFRAEVDLHRDLRDELGDPDQLRLRRSLDQFMLHPPPLEEAPKPVPVRRTGWLRWIGLTVLVALAGLLIRQGFFSPPTRSDSPLPPAVADSILRVPTPTPQPDTPSSTPGQDKNPPLIAAADPRDFVPNPALEDRISDQVRGGADPDMQIELSSPAVGATVVLQEEAVLLSFQGQVLSDSLPADRPLRLFIYSNRPETWEQRQPRRELPFPLQPDGPGTYAVRFQRRLLLTPGLYYLMVGQARGAEDGEGYRALWFGKVVVETAK